MKKAQSGRVKLRTTSEQEICPEESKHAHKVRMQAARFTVIGDRLYWQSFGGPYLICLDSRKAQYVLVELYEGICDSLT